MMMMSTCCLCHLCKVKDIQYFRNSTSKFCKLNIIILPSRDDEEDDEDEEESEEESPVKVK